MAFATIDGSAGPSSDRPIQWQKCIICQADTREKLVNPYQNTRGNNEEGYELLANNLNAFHDIGAMPFDIDISKLNDGSGLKNCLSKRKASWHKSCYLKFNNTKLNRARKRTESPQKTSPKKTRQSHDSEYVPETCLFCEKPGTRSMPLSKVMTKQCNDHIIECATALRDSKMLAKTAERCDLISLEAHYHNKCWTLYKNRRRSLEKGNDSVSNSKKQVHSIVLAGLVAYIDDFKEMSPPPVFSMSELVRLYSVGMKELGFNYDVHSTRLKDSLLEECPYLQSCDKPGRESLIAFNKDIDNTVRLLSERNYDREGTILSSCAKMIREDLFTQNKDGEDSIPPSLIALVKMIMYGPSISKTNEGSDKIPLRMAELLSFHVVKNRENAETSRRHNKDRETSTPVYLAMKLYGETRKKKLIDCTFNLGLSISYSRLNSILTKKANDVCDLYHREGVVCPPSLVKDIFITAAVDNLDHNTTATTAQSSFHGTAITLMQHFRSGESGTPRDCLDSERTNKKNVIKLPADYSIVQPCFVDVKRAKCSQTDICTLQLSGCSSPFREESDWLDNAMSEKCVPWSTYHAGLDRGDKSHTTNVALLPLFTENAHSPAMMQHTINIVKKSVQYLNPNQTPVIVADQPLYALLKQLQYSFPATFGEENFFMIMGGLHLEMAALKVAGQWLDGSGWISALVQASVTTQGRAESMVSASHVTRSRYAHQVTAAALYALQKRAFIASVEQDENNTSSTFEEWRSEKCRVSPQFKFWDVAMNLELLVLQFVRAIRKGDFVLYLESLRRLVPWFFSLDHVNYARWASVQIRDLANIKETHPDLAQYFADGMFVARKSERPFSAIAFDQAHEQVNALIKGDGGMVGLTESPDALRKWMIGAPELAKIVEAFESDEFCFRDSGTTETHHGETKCATANFLRDLRSLESVLDDLGNPFLEESSDLYNIDSKQVMTPEVVETVNSIEERGETQYLQFAEERLRNGRSLYDPIKLNKLPLFNACTKRTLNKAKAKITGLKNDCSLFSKLYLATCEHRSGDLDVFFSHENQPSPPSLSVLGELRSCVKSDLTKCLLSTSEGSTISSSPFVHAKIWDGAAAVHMLNPGQSKIFQEYVQDVFLPFLLREIESVVRIDLVWDRYDANSLKNATRQKRGAGIRTRVSSTTKIPKGWSNFLRDSTNKEELFDLLAASAVSITPENGKEIYTTRGSAVLTTSPRDVTGSLCPCNHEEADTRIMVHLADAVAEGHLKVLIRTVDTDVLVLAVACVQKIPDLEELWVHLGTGKNHQYVAAHAIADSLGPKKSMALPLFHAFTGCDVVSSFSGKGKKTAFEAWKAYPEATEGFVAATEGDVEKACPILEKFVVAMYERASSCTSVNECRKFLFTKKDRELEKIPPTQNALQMHIKRSIYQGVHVWGQTLTLTQNLPCPSEWGWQKYEDDWEPKWTSLPIASEACVELIRCRCKKQCDVKRCNCAKRQLKCTQLCDCGGDCL